MDIMLQPSWTWGPNAMLHAYANRLRAVEHGFTHIRCTQYGVSGVFDAFHHTISEKLTLAKDDGFIAQVPLRGRTWTLYNQIGDVLGVTCILVSGYWILVSIRLLLK